jgi:hypothetical protein
VSGIEDYPRETEELELALTRKAVALGIDWENPVQLRDWARQALDYKPSAELPHDGSPDETRLEFFGLVQLMLHVMTESASEGVTTHGGPHWKAFAHALWHEKEARKAAG